MVAVVGEHPLDPLLAQRGFLEPALLLDGEVGEGLEERGSEHAALRPCRRPARAADFDAPHAAARRTALQHVAREPLPRELGDAQLGEAAHVGPQVATRALLDEAERVSLAFEMERGARHAEAELHLRAYR